MVEYPADHPVCLALCAIVRALTKEMHVIQALDDMAVIAGVAHGSYRFDEAAELVGQPYCRPLDLYVDRETKRKAEALHFTEAHRALCS